MRTFTLTILGQTLVTHGSDITTEVHSLQYDVSKCVSSELTDSDSRGIESSIHNRDYF